jgi:hypothetical protein
LLYALFKVSEQSRSKMNPTELIEFNRANREASEFVVAATDDYVACRCCLLNGLFPGLRLGAESIEKYLKAFVLYGDPSRKVKKHRHRIKDLALLASSLKPQFSAVQFGHVIDRLETHYRHRYPDVRDFKRDASTSELVGIDEIVLNISECLPIPEVPKFRNYGYYFFVCCSWTPSMHPYKKWLEQENVALQRVRASLLTRYHAVEEQLGESKDSPA